jgi:AcrR family transcriptional regulator
VYCDYRTNVRLLMTTREKLQDSSMTIFALWGYGGLSMRRLAEEVGISLSVAYHYFRDKNVLLKEIFDDTNLALGRERHLLKKPASAPARMRQIIDFQFDHAKEITFVLKYYLYFRDNFGKLSTGFIPAKGYKHIEEILKYGIERGEFRALDIQREAKVITHAINGFILEYFPDVPVGKEREKVIEPLCDFILRAIEPLNSQKGESS